MIFLRRKGAERPLFLLLYDLRHNDLAAAAAVFLRLRDELAGGVPQQRCDALETAQFETLAAQYDGVGSVLLMQPAMESDAVRRLCDMVAARCCGRCAVFSGEDGAYKYAVIHPGGDIRELIKTMNTALNGRGGGRDGFAQGSAACTEADIRSFFGGLN